MQFQKTAIPNFPNYINGFKDYYQRLSIQDLLVVTAQKNYRLNVKQKKMLQENDDNNKYEWVHSEVIPTNLQAKA